MAAFRSHLFNVVFYANLVVWLLVALVCFALPPWGIIRVAQGWARSSLWLLERIVGTRVVTTGLDAIPPGPLLVASKHQSFLDIFPLLAAFDAPAFILKHELQLIPVFGWLTIKARMIPVRRGGSTALAAMNREAVRRVREGRQVIIFPEGTRRPPGAPPAYRNGAGHLYAALGVPCLPVALDTGFFWPRRQTVRRPGTATIALLPTIPPGLDRAAFMATLQERIETASDRLRGEAGGQPG